jgi:hypothetical protein
VTVFSVPSRSLTVKVAPELYVACLIGLRPCVWPRESFSASQIRFAASASLVAIVASSPDVRCRYTNPIGNVGRYDRCGAFPLSLPGAGRRAGGAVDLPDRAPDPSTARRCHATSHRLGGEFAWPRRRAPGSASPSATRSGRRTCARGASRGRPAYAQSVTTPSRWTRGRAGTRTAAGADGEKSRKLRGSTLAVGTTGARDCHTMVTCTPG